MVGHLVLVQGIVVRVHVGQQKTALLVFCARSTQTALCASGRERRKYILL